MFNVNKGSGLTHLPSAKGKGKSAKKIWNIYRQFNNTSIYYYHLKPYKRKDILISADINPDNGMEIVNMHCKKKNDRR